MELLAHGFKTLPRRVAVMAENFSKARFREQGWHDKTLERWQKRKGNTDPSRGTLIKSGALARSIKGSSKGYTITISSSMPYAKAHNEGLDKTVSETVATHTRKAHTRKAHTRGGRKVAAVRIEAHTVGSFTRKRHISLPKRQFIGSSDKLFRSIDKIVHTIINNALK